MLSKEMKRIPSRRRLGKESGVGLIEVLIAAFVMAVGILGMAAMQLTAKRNGYEALQRSYATAAVNDILERIRSNPSAVDTYVAVIGGSSISTAPSSCNSSSCTPTQLATRDLYEIEQALDGAAENAGSGGLVDPRACIENTAGQVTITLVWRGVADLVDTNTANDCGEGLGLYDVAATDDNRYRRFLTISSFIAEI